MASPSGATQPLTCTSKGRAGGRAGGISTRLQPNTKRNQARTGCAPLPWPCLRQRAPSFCARATRRLGLRGRLFGYDTRCFVCASRAAGARGLRPNHRMFVPAKATPVAARVWASHACSPVKPFVRYLAAMQGSTRLLRVRQSRSPTQHRLRHRHFDTATATSSHPRHLDSYWK